MFPASDPAVPGGIPDLRAIVERLHKSDPDAAEKVIRDWIETIDRVLSQQLAAIVHHEVFQRLEATWRGLHYLVQQVPTGANLQVQVLNVSKRELLADPSLRENALVAKIYEDGYLAGRPFGLLVADYEFGKRPDDIELLALFADVAALAQAPFVAAAAPGLLGLERFTELTVPRDLAKMFAGADLAGWKSFRESENSRYVALTLPCVLARLPYDRSGQPVDAFDFQEFVDGEDHDRYLWMSAAWAYAAVVANAFANRGWLERTYGIEDARLEGLPTGSRRWKGLTEVLVEGRYEYDLSRLGFLPLVDDRHRDCAVFMSAQSCQKPARYFDEAANATAELLAKMSVTLCLARLLNGLVLQARGVVGGDANLPQWQQRLNGWLHQYIGDGNAATAAQPLSAARVELRRNKEVPHYPEAVVSLGLRTAHGELTARLICELVHLRW
jgi:type VI secretion system protein ImpC